MVFERAIIDLDKLKPHGIEMWLHSIRRYQFASSFVRATDSVLDLCCGTGYGTSILSQSGDYVLGLEKSAEAVKYARKKYPYCFFENEDITEYGYQVSFDVITMFECLDHLKKEDGLIVLEKASVICKEAMLLSLPQDQKFNTNSYHLAEWSDTELKEELHKCFSIVLTFGQSWSTGQIVYPYDERRSMTIFVGIK